MDRYTEIYRKRAGEYYRKEAEKKRKRYENLRLALGFEGRHKHKNNLAGIPEIEEKEISGDIYKIYHDGSHFVGTKTNISGTGKKKDKDAPAFIYFVKSNYPELVDSACALNSDVYKYAKQIRMNLWKDNYSMYMSSNTGDICRYLNDERRRREKAKERKNNDLCTLSHAIEEYYAEYKSTKRYIGAVRYIRNVMDAADITYTFFDRELPDQTINEIIDKEVRRIEHNIYARRKRFIRKAYLGEWNYFVTFTYADAKQTEESFDERLRRCLTNLSYRRGWKYMMVPERGEVNGRYHLHALLYIPEGQMIGELFQRDKWSSKNHRHEKTLCNSFFFRKFGDNDFSPIDKWALKCGDTLKYMCKYLSKSMSRVIYCRGIPTEIYSDMTNDDIAGEFYDYVNKVVFFDSSFDTNFMKLALEVKGVNRTTEESG